jgi:cytochrome c-type biogenesis protein CcmH
MTGRAPGLRRWAPWVLLVVAAAVALGIGLRPSGRPPTLDARVAHLAAEVRCPVCNGETVAQSQSTQSAEIRAEIRQDLQRGESDRQILDSLVASYGPGILESPRASGIGLLVWLVPLIAAVVGAVVVAVVVGRWRRPGAQAAPPVPGGPGGPEGPAPSATGPEPGAPGADAPEAGPSEADAPEAGAPEPADPAPAVAAADTAPEDQVPAHGGRARVLVTLAVGLVLIGGGVTWIAVSRSGGHGGGTGAAVSTSGVNSELLAANAYQSKGDFLDAIKEYQKVLAVQPAQVEALTGQGWLLADTGEPSLVQQGLQLLQKAETVSPSYGPAHIYRGLTLLAEGDYINSVPELQWYLAHDPDPKLVAEVRAALVKARAGAAAEAAGTPTTVTPRS